MEEVDKVVFVVDRADLDYQTTRGIQAIIAMAALMARITLTNWSNNSLTRQS